MGLKESFLGRKGKNYGAEGAFLGEKRIKILGLKELF